MSSTELPPASRPWVVAGGGPAALAAARRLADSPVARAVFLISDNPAPGFGPAIWPSLVAGHLRPAEVIRLAGRSVAAPPLRRLHAAPLSASDQVLRLQTRDGEETLPFERLIWAIETLPSAPTVPGLDLPGVFLVRTTAECLAFAEYLERERPRRGVVVGATGPALSLASALHTRSVHLTLFDGGEPLLPGFDPALVRALPTEFRRSGVPFFTQAPLTALEAGRRGHRRERLRRVGSTRTSVVADFVAIILGVQSGTLPPEPAPEPPRSPAGEGIFVLATRPTPGGERSGSEPLEGPSEFWQERVGIAVAEAALGAPSQIPPDTGLVVCRAFDLEFARTARPPALDQLVRTTLDAFAPPEFPARPTEEPDRVLPPDAGRPLRLRFALWTDPRTGHLAAAQVAGRSGAAGRARVLAAAIRGGLCPADLADLDLGLAGPLRVP